MLSEITIENVAVIERATVNFGAGLNVLTGETGAGKSILIDSINAILGSRTSRDIVRSNTDRARIWAKFNSVPKFALEQLQNAGYNVEDELLLYRDITAEGKSNFRINGMAATAAVVREIFANLISIHGQHDNQDLLNPSKHLKILDTFANINSEHEAYYEVYKELCKVKREIDALSMDEDEKLDKIDLLRFQVDEIEKANLIANEEESLTAQKNVMLNAQSITQHINEAYSTLSGNDDTQGAVQMVGSAANSLESIAQVSDEIAPLSEKLSDLFYQLREVASEVGSMQDGFNFDVSQLEEVQDRLDLIYKLKQKYKTDISGILEYAESAVEQLQAIELGTERLDELYEKQEKLYEKAKELAAVLTQTRLSAFEKFDSQISAELNFLNMPGISFKLQHKTGPLASAGQDSLEFYICTNPGEQAKPLAKIASGGELSRIMLALKSALADKDDIGTVIYDEIDTGVSGLAAARIGEKLKQTSNAAKGGRQVICITHTAQIAAFANEHLLIKKSVENDRTFTQIYTLAGEKRVREIARMISGDQITDLALANAREMLEIHMN